MTKKESQKEVGRIDPHAFFYTPRLTVYKNFTD